MDLTMARRIAPHLFRRPLPAAAKKQGLGRRRQHIRFIAIARFRHQQDRSKLIPVMLSARPAALAG